MREASLPRLHPGSLGVTLALVIGGVLLMGWVVRGWSSQEPSEAPPVRQLEASGLVVGDELLLVLIGASFCHAAEAPGFKEALESAKKLVRAQGGERNQQVGVIGVALDWDPAKGLEWLGHFGEFDEIASGRNWLNAGAVKYIWRDIPGSSALPQLIVVRRTVEPSDRTISIGREEVLLRKLGATEIIEWANAGAPVPR